MPFSRFTRDLNPSKPNFFSCLAPICSSRDPMDQDAALRLVSFLSFHNLSCLGSVYIAYEIFFTSVLASARNMYCTSSRELSLYRYNILYVTASLSRAPSFSPNKPRAAQFARWTCVNYEARENEAVTGHKSTHSSPHFYMFYQQQEAAASF